MSFDYSQRSFHTDQKIAKRPFPSTFATALRGAPRTLSSKIAYLHGALATADRVAHNMQCQSDIERVTAGQNTAGRAKRSHPDNKSAPRSP